MQKTQGRVVAAKIYLRDCGYSIFNARVPGKDPFQSETDLDHFEVCCPPPDRQTVYHWTCEDLVAEAQRRRSLQSIKG